MQSGSSSGVESLATLEAQRKALINTRAKLEVEISKEFNAIVVEHMSSVTTADALSTKPRQVTDSLNTAIDLINDALSNEEDYLKPIKSLEQSTLFKLKPNKLQKLQNRVQDLSEQLTILHTQTPNNAKAKRIAECLATLRDYDASITAVKGYSENKTKYLNAAYGSDAKEIAAKIKELKVKYKAELAEYDRNHPKPKDKEALEKATKDRATAIKKFEKDNKAELDEYIAERIAKHSPSTTDKIAELEKRYNVQLTPLDAEITKLDREIGEYTQGKALIPIDRETELENIEYLIKSGARDKDGNNVLHHIIQYNPKLLAQLIEKYKDKEGNVPILHDLVNQVNSNGLSPLAVQP